MTQGEDSSDRAGRTAASERIYLSPPDVRGAEREALLRALESNWIAPLGPEVDAFEYELAGLTSRRHAAALSSGTAALHLALRLVGVERGDVVLAPTLTFVATINPIRYLGAEPILIDCEPQTWGIDPDLVAEELERLERLGRPAKAVLAVDLYGQCCDYDRLEPLCREYGVPLIEDAAESLGSTYNGRPAGSFGELAALSFNGNKIVTTSGGGMLLGDDGATIEEARRLASQAREPALHYEHVQLGYNYRLSNLLAALGRAQVETLERRIEIRREHFDAYAEALTPHGVEMMPEARGSRSNRWLTVCTLPGGLCPAEVCAELEARNIEARRLWKPMHLQALYGDCRAVGGRVATRLFERGICLPSGSGMTSTQRDAAATALLGALTGS